LFARLAEEPDLLQDVPMPTRDETIARDAIDYGALAAEVRERAFAAKLPADLSAASRCTANRAAVAHSPHDSRLPLQPIRDAKRNPRNKPHRDDTSRDASPRRGRFAAVWLASFLALAAFFGLRWLNAGAPLDAPEVSARASAAATATRSPQKLAIEEIRVGRRLQADNPELDEATPRLEVVPSENCLRILERETDDSLCHIEQLVSLEELEFDGGQGGVVYLDLPELGIAGDFHVLETRPCPGIRAGNGRIVTATFRHESKTVLDLRLEGEPEPLGVTANHPFWSLDRQTWVHAGDLHIGERLESLDGSPVSIAEIAQRPGIHTVYNVEVEGEHVYHVGPRGVLVHNTYRKTSLAKATSSAPKVSRVWPKHHPFPTYLGGAVDQTLKKIPRNLHYRFHSALDRYKGGIYSRRLGSDHFQGSDKASTIRDLRGFYRKAEGGIFSKYLPDFNTAVIESGY